jgi:predicted CopG family antitoxin
MRRSRTKSGERLIWLEASAVNKLSALRRPGESYSDVILRVVKL